MEEYVTSSSEYGCTYTIQPKGFHRGTILGPRLWLPVDAGVRSYTGKRTSGRTAVTADPSADGEMDKMLMRVGEFVFRMVGWHTGQFTLLYLVIRFGFGEHTGADHGISEGGMKDPLTPSIDK